MRFLLPSISIARRITGGGYIRHYQFGGGGALPAAHSFAILSTALLPRGFFCRQYNRTAHYRRRLYPALSLWRRRRITGGAFFRHLKHCAITGAIIAVRTAAFLLRFLLPSISIARRITGGGYIRHYQFGGGGALPAAAFLSPPPIAVIYRRHLLSAP